MASGILLWKVKTKRLFSVFLHTSTTMDTIGVLYLKLINPKTRGNTLSLPPTYISLKIIIIPESQIHNMKLLQETVCASIWKISDCKLEHSIFW